MKCLALPHLCVLFGFLAVNVPGKDYPSKGYLTFDNLPMGSEEKPLVLRTFVPTIGLSASDVLPNHSTGAASPKYSARSGKEASKQTPPIHGIPAAIAVNMGKTLSYVWDTTECRLLYAWRDGFLNMKNYWGDPTSGRRRGFGYVPNLYGFVFYKAVGPHPVEINGQSLSSLGTPAYLGFTLGHDRIPTYKYKAGKSQITIKVEPGPSTQTLKLSFASTEQEKLGFKSPNTQVQVLKSSPGLLHLVIRPNAGENFLSEGKKVEIKKPTKDIGEGLYTTLGCIACHSLDGGKNHGPTLKGSYGAKREFQQAEPLVVDEDYIRESIEKPMAKTVKGYTSGMMPPYQLQKAEYDSLILFIKSVR